MEINKASYHEHITLNDTKSRIEDWAIERNLHTAEPMKQIVKLGEEFGELCSGLAKGKDNEVRDAIGDMFVVLTILAMQSGTDIEDCAALAYQEIKDRKGKMVNGVFVKESDISSADSIKRVDVDESAVDERNPLFSFKLSEEIASGEALMSIFKVFEFHGDARLYCIVWDDESTIYEKEDVMKKIQDGIWIKVDAE